MPAGGQSRQEDRRRASMRRWIGPLGVVAAAVAVWLIGRLRGEPRWGRRAPRSSPSIARSSAAAKRSRRARQIPRVAGDRQGQPPDKAHRQRKHVGRCAARENAEEAARTELAFGAVQTGQSRPRARLLWAHSAARRLSAKPWPARQLQRRQDRTVRERIERPRDLARRAPRRACNSC